MFTQAANRFLRIFVPKVRASEKLATVTYTKMIFSIGITHFLFNQSGRTDLNCRPLGPEPSALAKLSHAPNYDKYIKRIFSSRSSTHHFTCGDPPAQAVLTFFELKTAKSQTPLAALEDNSTKAALTFFELKTAKSHYVMKEYLRRYPCFGTNA